MKFCLTVIAAFLRLGITPVKTTPAVNDPVNGPYGQTGAMANPSGLGGALTSLVNNAAPAFGNWSQTLIPNSLAASTYNGNSMVGGIIRRFNSVGGSTQDSTDTATNIVNAIPGATPLQTFLMLLANMGSGALTMAANTGVTLAGTNVVGGFSVRLFLGQVTGSAAVTMTGLFSLPLSSGL